MESQITRFAPIERREGELKHLAGYLANVADARRIAGQEQRNKLTSVLFEEIAGDPGGI
jgi:hypothetical protein